MLVVVVLVLVLLVGDRSTRICKELALHPKLYVFPIQNNCSVSVKNENKLIGKIEKTQKQNKKKIFSFFSFSLKFIPKTITSIF